MINWDIPSVSLGFSEERPQGPQILNSLKSRMNEAADKSPLSRAEIAHQMSLYLGTKITEATLNQYLSPSAGDKNVNLARLAAFIHATDSIELLGYLPSLFGFHVVSSKHAALVRRELLKEHLTELQGEIDQADQDYRGAP